MKIDYKNILLAAFFGAVIVMILSWAVGLFWDLNNPCLIEIAEDYCEDNGMEFNSLYYYSEINFRCLEGGRGMDVFKYRFTGEELERCRK